MNNHTKNRKKVNKENVRKTEEDMEVDNIFHIENKVKADISEKMYHYVLGVKIQNVEIKK
jgi:hypothetical protein